MERLSNSYQELIKQVRQEFQTLRLKDSEGLLISYSEIPWFPGGQFCISIISSTKKNHLKLILQKWDNRYDLSRFSSGVYNLDRLCIKRTDIDFSSAQRNELTTILNSIGQFPDSLNDKNSIVLDGIDYELILNTTNTKQKYLWKVATNDLKRFEPLINFLWAVASDK